ncbi:serine protease [Paracoccus sp. S3-43]|uniref:trypsin-like serine peptidase n=1 Tax=Paracoccus sp. S3-43 TaxID=3030011 RepID=UPI0023B06242|nr:serine protease [Paracoccus sp. S3-43]WEF24882.1 serine protease [Paracoccus sp. S3-43]
MHAWIKDLGRRDPDLVDAIRRKAGSAPLSIRDQLDPAARALLDVVAGPEAGAQPETALETGVEAGLESIILTQGRPVLDVVNGEADVQIIDDDAADIIRDRLKRAESHLRRAIPAVGRIEVSDNPQGEWFGTGWLLGDGLIVTNRHVAAYFAIRERGRFVFRPGLVSGHPQTARIDFQEERGGGSQEVPLAEILWMAPERGPDIAFLKTAAPVAAQPIELDTELPAAGRDVAVIGYPAFDSRIPDFQLMERLFGRVYNHKRLAPGKVLGMEGRELTHDCTSLGGNSGSVVLDLDSGKAVGLHFTGFFLRANYAVPAPVIAEALRDLSRPGSPRSQPQTSRHPPLR